MIPGWLWVSTWLLAWALYVAGYYRGLKHGYLDARQNDRARRTT